MSFFSLPPSCGLPGPRFASLSAVSGALSAAGLVVVSVSAGPGAVVFSCRRPRSVVRPARSGCVFGPFPGSAPFCARLALAALRSVRAALPCGLRGAACAVRGRWVRVSVAVPAVPAVPAAAGAAWFSAGPSLRSPSGFSARWVFASWLSAASFARALAAGSGLRVATRRVPGGWVRVSVPCAPAVVPACAPGAVGAARASQRASLPGVAVGV
jgi:hypothetical protein